MKAAEDMERNNLDLRYIEGTDLWSCSSLAKGKCIVKKLWNGVDGKGPSSSCSNPLLWTETPSTIPNFSTPRLIWL